MAYSTLADVIADVNLRIIANNEKLITGPQLNTILLGIIQFISPTLQADIIANLGSSGQVGGVADGADITAGTTIEQALRDILIATIHPTYVLPDLVETSDTTPFFLEAGSIINPILDIVYTQNDAGAIVTKTLKLNGTTISSALPFTDTSRQIIDGDNHYDATITYAQGAVKNNNLGAPDAVGRIIAGSIVSDNTITYSGLRYVFYSTLAEPTDSATIRTFPGQLLGLEDGDVFTIDIPEGASVVSIAMPNNLQIKSILYYEMGSQVKYLFGVDSVSVEGANGYSPMNYRTYTFLPVEAFQVGVTYIITLETDD